MKDNGFSIPCAQYCKNIKAGHYRPISETPLEWRFTDGPIVAQDCLLAGLFHASVNGYSILFIILQAVLELS